MMKLRNGILAIALALAFSVSGVQGQTAPAGAKLLTAAKTYRLTYTFTELDGSKRVGTQHFSVIVISGGRTTLKQGSKIPVVTGTYNAGVAGTQTQMTYLDVGENIDASLEEAVDGMRLKTKVEQSSIAEEKSSVGAQDPIVRQTVLEGTSIVTEGKPLMLGSIDIPGTTRHLDVEVVLEGVR
jgi:type II secretory pathway component GspD/PulD (secretin)